jgi:hypothetical protein
MSDNSSDTLHSTSGASRGHRPILVRVLKWTLASVAIIAATPFVLAGLVLLLLYFESGPTGRSSLEYFYFLDRSFAIPANYQPDLYGREYGGAGILDFEALLPEFTPYSHARRSDWFSVRPDKPNLNVFVSALRSESPFEHILEIYQKDLLDPDGEPAVGELRLYETTEQIPDSSTMFFFPENDVDGPAYIECHRSFGKISPGCSLYFIYDNVAEVEVWIGSDRLAHWREIAAGIRRLLKSFETH